MGMGGLRDIEAKLPPGFRFYPRDEELVAHYLYKKVVEGSSSDLTLMEVDLHTCEPWMLPDEAKVGGNEWYFYSFRDRKYATGLRANRATTVGYWKATGKDRPIYDPTTYGLIGMRKTLVFYRGRAPSGVKSSWVMHEFRLENPHIPPKEDWVLCRVFHKSRGNPSKFSSGGDASCSSPPNLESSPQNEGSMIELERFDQGLFSSFMHQEDASPSSMLNLMDFQYNFLDLSPMEDHTLSSVVATKSEYKYGFMYDTGLEGRTLNDRGLPQQETVASEEDEKKGFL